MLGEEVRGAVFVDAYAGSGAVGIEALSRGARTVVFVEKDLKAVAVIRENLRLLGVEGRGLVVAKAAARGMRGAEADIVFLDPPYGARQEYEAALGVLGASPPGVVVVEHDRRMELAAAYGGLARERVLRQGDSCLSFYRRRAILEP